MSDLFEFIVDTQGVVLAIKRSRRGIAMPLIAKRGDSVVTTIVREFYHRHSVLVTELQVIKCLGLFKAQAMSRPAVDLPLRVARHDGAIFIDTGWDTGEVICISPAGWEIVTESPVVFRRPPGTKPFLRPSRRSNLMGLHRVLNVSDEGFAVVVVFMISALVPDIDHGILDLLGEKGSGKTRASRYTLAICGPTLLIDARMPRAARDFTAHAANSWTIAYDNVRKISDEQADELCRLATGGSAGGRELYTDSDLRVDSYRRVVVLTSTEIIGKSNEVSDRLMTVKMSRANLVRVDESALDATFDKIKRSAFTGLLDLLVQVLEVLPAIPAAEEMRLAGVGRIAKAVDQLLGTRAYNTLVAGARETAAEVVAEEPVLAELTRFLRDLGRSGKAEWVGTTGALLAGLSEQANNTGRWPRSTQKFAALLRRYDSDLRMLGFTYTPPSQGNRSADRSRERKLTLTIRADLVRTTRRRRARIQQSGAAS